MKIAINYRPKPGTIPHPLHDRVGYCDIEQLIVDVGDEKPIDLYLKALRNDHGNDCVVSWFAVGQ